MVDAAISFALHFTIWIKRDIFGDNFGTVVSVITILTTFQWVVSVKLQLLTMDGEDSDRRKAILIKVSMEWMKQKGMVYAMFECINFLNLLAMVTAYLIA